MSDTKHGEREWLQKIQRAFSTELAAVNYALRRLPPSGELKDVGDPVKAEQALLELSSRALKCAQVCSLVTTIIRAQSMWRRHVARRLFTPLRASGIIPDIVARNLAYNNLARAEKTFLNTLSTLNTNFRIPLRRALGQDSTVLANQPVAANVPVLTADDIAVIFGPLEEIMAISGEINRRLSYAGQQFPRIFGIGDIFLDVAPRLAIFGTYAKNVPVAIETVSSLIASNQKFAAFLNCIKLPGTLEGMKLIDLLPIPLNQISQYELQLRNMMNATTSDMPACGFCPFC